jgi:integrase
MPWRAGLSVARPRERQSAYLIQNDKGRPLSMLALRGRFDKARKAAGVDFQFRDIRAKTASDLGDLAHAQSLVGHKNRDMTEHYVRQGVGSVSDRFDRAFGAGGDRRRRARAPGAGSRREGLLQSPDRLVEKTALL